MERQYSYDEKGEHEEDNQSGNMIIHGDNLEALKALLPKYEGKITCIYIDPPYNTGNENWIYNDNVNDPKMKKWLGQTVGKEGEDLSRHDKWLCMMYPRLRLLQKLLSDDGAIFISIDDNELYNLKAVCDEIFGVNCFVSNTSWQRTYSMRNDVKGIAAEVEHILVYGKKPLWQPNKLERTSQMDAKYKNPDNDPRGAWRNIVASAPNAYTHQGMVYAIQNPLTGEYAYPPQGRCWSLGQDQMLEAMNQWCEYQLVDLKDYEERASVCNVPVEAVRKDVLAIVLKDSLEAAHDKAAAKYKHGTLPEFFFSKKGYGTLSRKAYIQEVGGRPVTNFWSFEETGHTDEASRLLKAIFKGTAVFDTPKPPRLIERILHIAGDKNAIIIDSFAGSGTTAHAVLNRNKAEEEVNDFEYEMVMALTGLDNIKWWHRNISRQEFCINGFINHYPDFIVMTKSGKILVIETKGDHLENRETKDKLAEGRAWQNLAGALYRYFLVFKSKELNIKGAYQIDRFIETLKQL